MRRLPLTLRPILLLLLLATSAPAALAADPVKIRIYSPDLDIDVAATGTLTGHSFTGRAVSDGLDLTIDGSSDSSTLTVNLNGTVVRGCGTGKQFMSGSGDLQGSHATISTTLDCPYRPTYNFIIDITLPPHPLAVPSWSSGGQSAAISQ